MGFHVKHARMTEQFLSKLIPCNNGRGYTLANAKINVVFRFPNDMIQAGEIAVIDLCREGGEDGHPKTFVCYLRKPKWIGMQTPRYNLELYLQGEIALPEKYQSHKTGIRWHHTINPQLDRDFPIILLRENENHVSEV